MIYCCNRKRSNMTNKKITNHNNQTLLFDGVITMTDTEAFNNIIAQGIGRAKAFGCGLLMIRRV